MATATTSEADVQVPLKLLVNKYTNKVIFAEANKDFVDILFSFLLLPLGTIARLVEKDSNIEPLTIGCLHSLYHSVQNLDNHCFCTQGFKQLLVQPRNIPEDYCNTLKLNIDDPESKEYFICSKSDPGYHRLAPFKTELNCSCGSPLTRVFLKHSFSGFVNDNATFVITDDLVVIPNSVSKLNLAVLQNSGIKDPSEVKEMTVNVTKEKILDLLKCSLISKSCLTYLLSEKKPILERSTFSLCSVEYDKNIEISLNLVIRKSDGKLLYAQGDNHFADMILSFLTFPLGGVIRILGGNCSLGCIDKLYKSIVDLEGNIYWMSEEVKKRLIDPSLVSYVTLINPIFPFFHPNHYKFCTDYVDFSSGDSTVNMSCVKNDRRYYPVTATVWYEQMFLYGFGYVKGPQTYLVTDDLVVAPFSTTSVLNLINCSKTPLSDLKEKNVVIGFKECINILKASLTSTSALTNGLDHFFTDDKGRIDM
ncbi:hypothetical protein DEO72_LG11g2163 [Vigna unguiculata]|uniref:DUF674 family protein n=1 Tax=Vigna unguiculata TaxID=3917 RepID=A0A4D6NR67_VIGUN|nr:hypothetical protein DEO72_LG11g2163 [Vigna unguiculata]